MNERVLCALGEVVTEVMDYDRDFGMVLTGGDTAISVCDAIGVRWTEAEGSLIWNPSCQTCWRKR